MAMLVDNPAARLHAILQAGKAQNVNRPAHDVWYEILRVEVGDHALLTARLADVMALPREIAVDMSEHYPDEGQMVAHWRGQVDRAFVTLHLAAPWNAFISQIDGHSMMHRSSTAKLLQHVTKLKPVNNTDLEDIRTKVNDLIIEVRNSDLDEDLKLSVVRYLTEILCAVDEYFITGVNPILDGINTAYGRAFTDTKYRELITGKTTLGQKLRAVLDDAATVTTIAANLHEIAPVLEAGWRMLSGG
ncbi:hypothetical protein [Paraburkholderia strydomiana]|uniref:hypothetical protein n=1 Tax=Paraburkholderia strydomiana TaxID=1245417 RepID=UPI0038BA715D